MVGQSVSFSDGYTEHHRDHTFDVFRFALKRGYSYPLNPNLCGRYRDSPRFYPVINSNKKE